MDSQLKKGFIEYCVLAHLKNNDSYGYKIMQSISGLVPITESTLYSMLKRLEKAGKVTTCSKICNGRSRKYYHLTDSGAKSIQDFLEEEWPMVEAIYRHIKADSVRQADL